MMNDFAIEVARFCKSYGPHTVLDRLDLSVTRGSVFALLGPNGAGKTTMVRILATLTGLDSGSARVAGWDVVTQRHEVRRRISLTGQFAALDGLQTGAENLRMMGRLLHLPAGQARARASELLERFDLVQAGEKRVSDYSGGMRRRLDLAAGLLRRPEVMFLDEPTMGLDLRSRQTMWQIVSGLAASGVTVFLTTQYLEEADQLADRVAILDGGRLVADGTPGELKQQIAGQRLDIELADAASYADVITYLGERATHTDVERLTAGIAITGDALEVRSLLDELDPHRQRISRFALHAASLDDVFLSLTGHRAPERETADV
jgi:ABC-2 type transport system ATP-binding protein